VYAAAYTFSIVCYDTLFPIISLPSLASFDDHSLRLFFSTAAVSAAKRWAQIEVGLCTHDSRHSPLQRVGALPRLATTLRSACNMGGSYMCAFVYTLLVCFILSKSASPLKELFTAAQWLHYYDDYFFVNAQGVFGFINSHRHTSSSTKRKRNISTFTSRETDHKITLRSSTSRRSSACRSATSTSVLVLQVPPPLLKHVQLKINLFRNPLHDC
jgi:hypothetical protein